MEVFEALYTTRAMRRVQPDPIPMDVQRQILDAAIRAPSGGNAQNWKFLLVDAPQVKAPLAELYRECLSTVWNTFYKQQNETALATPDDPETVQWLKVKRSADWLAENFERVPLFLFGFSLGDPTGGSIFPAVWNAMLAARAHGVGSALTSAFMLNSQPVLDTLGVPQDEGWVFACCVSMGYPTGRWAIAPRRPVHEVSYRNRWGEDIGFQVPEPLWKG